MINRLNDKRNKTVASRVFRGSISLIILPCTALQRSGEILSSFGTKSEISIQQQGKAVVPSTQNIKEDDRRSQNVKHLLVSGRIIEDERPNIDDMTYGSFRTDNSFNERPTSIISSGDYDRPYSFTSQVTRENPSIGRIDNKSLGRKNNKSLGRNNNKSLGRQNNQSIGRKNNQSIGIDQRNIKRQISKRGAGVTAKMDLELTEDDY